MTAMPLFPAPPPAPVVQTCDACGRTVHAADDSLRVRGWIVFDGVSVTGKPLRVRLCNYCRKAQHEERDL